MKIRRYVRGGFALPTVLIASVVMMIVLVASVSSVAAVRTSLKTQYYEQLAKAAGEAGVAYAKACLAKNANMPLWTDAKPLTPATDCAGNVIISNCPSDVGCSVAVNGNVRSSFSVPRPKIDGNGRAVTIANTGYVELLRASNGAVWRTYRQPAVQSAAVPDLCSGAATTSLGWTNAASSSPTVVIPGASGAATISAAAGAEAAGYMYFRKDFPVFEDGSYNATILTPSAQDVGDIYVDGAYITTSNGSVATSAVSLTPGCHTVTVRLNNRTINSRESSFAAAIQRPNAAPVVGTDTSWRVATGEVVHYSSPNYYADPTQWSPATIRSQRTGTWVTESGDSATQTISLPCGASCPYGVTTYYRNTHELVLSSPTEVKFTSICDDACNIYMNGNLLFQAQNVMSQQTMTLPAGTYNFGVSLYNGGSSLNPTGVALTLVNTSNSYVLLHTDATWQVSDGASTAGNNSAPDPGSYNAFFIPSPNDTTVALASVLAVAGGGGGGNNAAGGGGAGGVVYVPRQELSVGTTYSIVVGAGGAGPGLNSSSQSGKKGGNSSFGGTLIVANGGGGGASRDGGTPTVTNGSGAGGAGATAAGIGIRDIPGIPTVGQGSYGGAGYTANPVGGGGGGGAGSPGEDSSATKAGSGGAAAITYITGMRTAFASGGGGSGTTNNVPPGNGGSSGGGPGGGGAPGGASGTIPAVALPGTGGGGGAGGGGTNSNGSAGGSGFVVIRVPISNYTVVVTGSYTTGTYASNTAQDYRYYRFNGAGTFRITAIN